MAAGSTFEFSAGKVPPFTQPTQTDLGLDRANHIPCAPFMLLYPIDHQIGGEQRETRRRGERHQFYSLQLTKSSKSSERGD